MALSHHAYHVVRPMWRPRGVSHGSHKHPQQPKISDQHQNETMRTKHLYSLAIAATFAALMPNVHAQVSQQTLDAISAPDKVETRLGTLEYKDGVPTPATVQKVYDNLDLMHAVDVYLNKIISRTFPLKPRLRTLRMLRTQRL